MTGTRRIFMTGATGFVGRAVVPALRAAGYTVRCLVRRGSEHELRGLEAIERVEGNVLAHETLERGMAGCDTVIHLVGIIREHPATLSTFERVHTQGTVNVLDAAVGRARVRKAHVPLGLVRPLARLFHRLPGFPLTPDQLLMLEEDNVGDPQLFYTTLGLTPVPLATGLRAMLG